MDTFIDCISVRLDVSASVYCFSHFRYYMSHDKNLMLKV